MESEDHFYLSLPSSASMELHPDNKISDFITELLNTINLERDAYEVGLSEIILDAEIENITETKLAFTIFRGVESVKKDLKIKNLSGVNYTRRNNERYYYESFSINRGLYRNLSSMFRHFNTKLVTSKICSDLIFKVHNSSNEENELITFKSLKGINMKDTKLFLWQRENWFRKCPYLRNGEYNHETDIQKIRNELKRHIPSMSDYIDRNDAIKNEAENSYHFVCSSSELLGDPGMAYIYTDVVDYQYVGNIKAPLLRVVHFPKDTRIISFPHIHYLPLNKTCISSIRIYIRDVEGRSYPFTNGTAMFKLHFRKKLR